MVVLVWAAVVAFCTTALIIPWCIVCAHKTSFLDKPDGVIKNQESPIPYLGGCAVALGWCVAFIFFSVGGKGVYPSHIFFPLSLCLLGLYDDHLPLTPLQKFVGQFVCCLIFYFLNSWWTAPFLPNVLQPIFALLWMLTVINGCNLIDVADGVTCASGISTLLGFALVSGALQDKEIFLYVITAIFSLAAFLRYNFPPARIYLGDAGSLLIGGWCVSLSSQCAPYISAEKALLVCSSFCALVVLELFFLVFVRTCYKIPFYQASPHHCALLLLQKGYTKKQVALCAAFFSFCMSCSAAALYFDYCSVFSYIFFMAFLTIFFGLFFGFCAYTSPSSQAARADC